MSEHDPKLSRLYQRGPQDTPSAELDLAIRQQAHEAVTSKKPLRRPRWMIPAASAATLLIGVGILLQLTPEALREPVPTIPAPVHSTPPLNSLVAPSAPTRTVTPNPAPGASEVPMDVAPSRSAPTRAYKAEPKAASRARRVQRSAVSRSDVIDMDDLFRSSPMDRSTEGAGTLAEKTDAAHIKSLAHLPLDELEKRLQQAPEKVWLEVIKTLKTLDRKSDAKTLDKQRQARWPDSRRAPSP